MPATPQLDPQPDSLTNTIRLLVKLCREKFFGKLTIEFRDFCNSPRRNYQALEVQSNFCLLNGSPRAIATCAIPFGKIPKVSRFLFVARTELKGRKMLHIAVINVGRGTKGHILASCRVQLTSEDGKDTLTILDARVLRNRSGELWVGYPSQSIQAFDGAQRYIPTLEMSRELQRRISEAVLAEFENVQGAPRRVEEFSAR